MQRVNVIMPKVGELFDFVKTNKITARAEIYNADTRNIFSDDFPVEAKKRLKEDSVDLIVTSPPYGDSHTTVAYGQFSRLSLLMLGYPNEQTLEVDKRSIGGRKNGTTIVSKTLEEVVGQMHQEVRKREVHNFFVDLSRCMTNLSKVLAPDGRACFVLGNRTVNGVRIPADKILIEIGEGVGLSKENVFYREIPNKRIPSKSSPTNIAGKKVDTMNKESIVILKKW
jgi:DNA modification methylase